jgi:hypothetical protein
MSRSDKAAWLEGPGDLREADVDDVPKPGLSVRVRGLSARYSAEVQSQMKLVTEGREQVARIDTAAMERLQFEHGCIEPTFGPSEVAMIQERFGPAFRKVIQKIDELSGIDKEAIENTSLRFPAGGQDEEGSAGTNGSAAGDDEPAVPVRAGA